jgi:hypothetical protein
VLFDVTVTLLVMELCALADAKVLEECTVFSIYDLDYLKPQNGSSVFLRNVDRLVKDAPR